MRSRALSSDHEAAVARRLELLTAELDAVRGSAGDRTTHIRAVPDPDSDSDLDPGSDSELDAGSDWGADSWSPSGYTRIRPVAEGAHWADESERRSHPPPGGPPPVRVAVPGRHAHRRFRLPWTDSVTDALPEPLRGRIGLAPGTLAVVAVVAALGLAVTCWWLVRGSAHQVAVPRVVSTGAPLATPVGAASALADPTASASPATKVVVDVAGKVRRPGIAVLRSGARIVDAIRAAGGPRRGVDLSSLNLAQVLTDGQQIVVGVGAAPVGSTAASLPPGGSPTGTLVNLNTADETTLESLPQVGPVTAQAIITWRTEHGGFSAVNQLLEVSGIGDATLAQLTPFVTI